MTLSEIETILADLAKRHTNLDKELLTTILLSAGWEEKSIKEALVLFGQMEKRKEVVASIPAPVEVISNSTITVVPITPESVVITTLPKEDITFYKTDGEEEGELHVFEETKLPPQKEISVAVPAADVEVTPLLEVPVVVEESDISIPIVEEVFVPDVQSAVVVQEVPAIVPVVPILPVEVITPQPQQESVQKDQESLIVHEEVIKEVPRIVREEKIPDNLPLLPFESSPHVWSFSRYKDVFHGEVMPNKEELAQHTTVVAPVVVPQKQVIPDVSLEDEIVVEKIPLNKNDESLVFLAGVMLLGIILILGYMYSNGRL